MPNVRLLKKCLLAALLFVLGGTVASAQLYVYSSYAGGAWPTLPAAGTSVSVGFPQSVAPDGHGGAYFSSAGINGVFRVDAAGALTVVAGSGLPSAWPQNYALGDGGPATGAYVGSPGGLAVDRAGTLYIADTTNNRIRRVVGGNITTVAGGGYLSSGDGQQATLVQLGQPRDVALDAAGNLYIADTASHRVRMVNTNGIITTVAGAGALIGSAASGHPAAQLSLVRPTGIAVDTNGNLYIADPGAYYIYKVDDDGNVTLAAGNGTQNPTADGARATSGGILPQYGLTADAAGNLYVPDSLTSSIRKVDTHGILTTAAGTAGSMGFAGDGGQANAARLSSPQDAATDSGGVLWIADTSNFRVRKVDGSGIISSVAGNSGWSYAGDGGPALNAQLSAISGLALDASGNLFIADTNNVRIRKVTAADGKISTVAGDGIMGSAGDGGAATSAELFSPSSVAVDSTGVIYIGDLGKVRKVGATGAISIAMTTTAGRTPFVAVDAADNLYVADSNRIRKTDKSGTVTTVAGTGTAGFSGDNGLATSAKLSNPAGMVLDATGILYFSDFGNARVRKVDLSGNITTVAGNGAPGYAGDNGPATSAGLASPSTLALDTSGNLIIADGAYVRKVDKNGIITSIAIAMNGAVGVAAGAKGRVYVAESAANTVRLLLPPIPDLTVALTHSGSFGQGQTGATYTITVGNSGTVPTAGTVTVTDTLPAKLTATAISGTGWNCTLGTLGCTRTDSLEVGASYPVITVTVDVAGDAPASVTNKAEVSGGGETDTSNDTALDPTVIGQPTDLAITKSHSGNFMPGQTGAIYTITVKNLGPGVAGGPVTVVDALPAKLTATAMSGEGWNCVLATLACTRTDTLAVGASHPPITLTVDVAADAPESVTNSATLSGGGDNNPKNNAAADPTNVVPASDLTITKTHTGAFSQGQTGAVYTIVVSNAGTISTNGAVTVVDTLPAKLTPTAMSGTGWNCTLSTLTCTRSEAIPPKTSYAPIRLTVNVAADAPSSVTNTAVVSGGGETNTSNDTAVDPTTISARPDLTISKMHIGGFTVGQTGATYTIVVSNAGAAPTTGTVTVVDTLPAGLTATAILGGGWTCTLAPITCTRSDALPAAQSYPPITLTVDVAASAPASVTNTATVSGGGEANTSNDTVADVTTINQRADLTVSKTHSGNFSQGQTGARYTITVSNDGLGPTSGAVTVVDTLPAKLAATAMSGTGWNCTLSTLTCTRNDVLAPDADYPSIRLTVNVAADAPASVINIATVSGGGETNTSNNRSSDTTTIIPVTPCTYAISPGGLTFAAAGGSGTVNVTAGPSCAWTASSSLGWVTITAPASGSGNGSVSFTVAQNTGNQRAGTITIAGLNFAVQQVSASASGARFVPVAPCRIADTRNPNGSFGGPAMTAGSSRSFTIPNSACGIPSTAQAYSLNVTVVPKGQLSFLTLWPTGQDRPFVSTLNALQGQVVANAAIVPAGTNGAVSAFVTDATDVILDINGYFEAPGAATSYSFYPAQPCRVADTRNPAGPLGGPSLAGNQSRDFPVPTSACGLPPTAAAYSLNVTAVPDPVVHYLGFLTTWPTGQTRPNASTLNSWSGDVVANAAIVPAGSSGSVSVFASNPTAVILDANGYFAAPGGAGALSFYPVTPCRVADTRGDAGPFGGPELSARTTRSFSIPASGCFVPSTAAAYSVNVTVVPDEPLAYLTVWPVGATQPNVSTLNSWDAAIVANAAIVPAGNGGAISVYVTNRTHVVLDINGYFAP